MNSVAEGASSAPTLNILAFAGAGTGGAKSTAAVNLAVAFAAAGLRVELRDVDPVTPAFRALARAADSAGPPVELPISRALRGRVTLAAGFPPPAAAPGVAAPDLLLLDCPTQVDADTERAVGLASLVLVPVDASPLALRTLGEVAELLSRQRPAAARLRVALARVLPRRIDRWGVVEELTERYPGALYATTVPLRRTGASHDAGARAPTLYAPTTRAAAAYAALALEVADDLGLRLGG
jgi:chromosome partitioning protein